MPEGRIELPTNPESFRGCSTAANEKLPMLGFSFVSRGAPSSGLLPAWDILVAQRFLIHLVFWLCAYVLVGAGSCGRPNSKSNRCNVGRSILEECNPTPC